MHGQDIEAKVAFAVERLLSTDASVHRALVRDLAAAWPDSMALELVFALTDAATRIDAMLSEGGESSTAARLGYRYAALLAADVFALEAGGVMPVTAADLRRHWCRDDPFFLGL